ncbi:MAG: EamA family transporter [Desertimonas sp.]
MGIAFAVLAAVTYGIADWCGGHAARRIEALAVTVIGQAASLVLVAVAIVVLADPVGGLWWGAAGGLAGVFGLVCFYTALAGGAMTVVAPVTAVVSLAVPVIVGVATGDRPSVAAWVGIGLAVVAVALVGGILGVAYTAVRSRDLMFAGLGGVGFGLIFVCLAQTPDDAGLWPLLTARVASVSIAGALLVARGGLGREARPDAIALRLALVAGMLDMTANVSYLIASRHELLSIVAAVTSMYPVSTIVLAVGFDRERVSRSQVLGMGLAGAAVLLVSAA